MKNIFKKFLFAKVLSLIFVLVLPVLLLSGCARNVVGYHITSMPNKIVYQVGETPNFDGLKIERLNNDGTHYNLRYSKTDIGEVDTSTAGVKKVKVTKGNMSVAFNIYVANVVVNDSDNLKSIFENLNDGDIVYLREGNYAPKNESDDAYKDVVINKSVTIVGDGRDKTKFFGNFIVGANFDGSVFSKLADFENVGFINIGFELKYKTKNGFINYSGPYGLADTNGAIRSFDTKNLMVSNCSFKGYGYGILADNAEGMTVQYSTFRYIQKNAIRVTSNIQNSTIFQNIMMDIAHNVISYEDDSLSHLCAISLNFDSKGQKGVSVCKNIFTRIALHDGDVVYFNEASKQKAEIEKNSLFRMTYIENSSAVALFSSTQDDLEVMGVVISTNNFNSMLQNIYYGERGQNTISSGGVIVID